MKKTYHGSCHCGTVKYRATLDLAKGTGRCNCTYCRKTRNWSASVARGDFELLNGAGSLRDYDKEWGEGNIHHQSCANCGTHLYGHGYIPEAGGDFLAICVNTLDDASIDELMSGEVRYMDGLHDDWMSPPADLRGL